MDELLIRLRQVLDSADTLYHESQVLTLQGDFHGSLRKKRAGDFAMEEHYKLNAAYRRLWMYHRKKQRPIPYPSFLCTGRDVGSISFLFTSSYFLIMTNATATPPALKHIFQNQNSQRSVAPKPVPTQKPEQKTPTPVKEEKLWWAYLTHKGKVCILRYVEKSPPDEKELLKKNELSTKEWTRLSKATFLTWFDDGDKSTVTANFPAPSRHAAGVVAAKLLAPAREKYLTTKKAAKTDAK